jgi:hypothetical protein
MEMARIEARDIEERPNMRRIARPSRVLDQGDLQYLDRCGPDGGG